MFCRTKNLIYNNLRSFESKTFAAKAELLQEGIFFIIHLFARDVLVMKKLEIGKTKPTFEVEF